MKLQVSMRAPFVSEIQGVGFLGVGVVMLGYSGILKVQECYDGQRAVMPYITDNAAGFYADLGIGFFKKGFALIAPNANESIRFVYTEISSRINSKEPKKDQITINR